VLGNGSDQCLGFDRGGWGWDWDRTLLRCKPDVGLSMIVKWRREREKREDRVIVDVFGWSRACERVTPGPKIAVSPSHS